MISRKTAMRIQGEDLAKEEREALVLIELS